MLARSLLIASLIACSACSKSKPLIEPGPTQAMGESGAGGAAEAGAPPVVVFDAARISSHEQDPNFQVISAALDLSGGPYQSATLIVDLGTTCVPFSSWADNRPPKGQNWPADCDAFDRNFEISLDGPDPGSVSTDNGAPSNGGARGESGASGAAGDSGASGATSDSATNSGEGGASSVSASTPGLELVRAITPFGGPLHLERDLTALANGLPGMHRIHARINTWSDAAGLVTGSNAGWNVTLKVALSKGTAPAQPLAIIPLFYGDLTTTNEVSASFTVPNGTARGYLEYRTTGHGGAAGSAFSCSGPAEEFCKRQHTISLDGIAIKSFTPWKTCASHCTLEQSDPDAGFEYCAENPCGDIASVKAPRANWCPGSETEPLTIDTPELATPGAHQVKVQVSDIAAGGNVHVSMTYYAFGD